MAVERTVNDLQNELNVLQTKYDNLRTCPVMSSEDRLWAVLWFCGTLVVITFISILGYNYNASDRMMLEAIKGGANPIDAGCAWEGKNHSQACHIRITGKAEK